MHTTTLIEESLIFEEEKEEIINFVKVISNNDLI